MSGSSRRFPSARRRWGFGFPGRAPPSAGGLLAVEVVIPVEGVVGVLPGAAVVGVERLPAPVVEVVPRLALQGVGACRSIEAVVARATPHHVVAVPTDEQVRAATAAEGGG